MIDRLPQALREPQRPIRAIFTGWAFAFFPSILLSYVMQWLLPQVARPSFDVGGSTAFILLVLFAPVVETLIMAFFLEIMLRLRIPPTVAILLSSAGWGIAHSLAAPVWGLVIWWPFLIFSTLYVTWSRRSIWAGVGVAAATHALHNLVPVLLLLRS